MTFTRVLRSGGVLEFCNGHTHTHPPAHTNKHTQTHTNTHTHTHKHLQTPTTHTHTSHTHTTPTPPHTHPQTQTVNTDSKVTLGTLQNINKHNVLIENIRKEIKGLEDLRWTVFFNRVKAHVGIQGSEVADRLAKKAATEDIGEIVHDKIPRETIITEEKENGLTK